MFAYCITYVMNALSGYMNERSKRMTTLFVLACLAFMSGTRYYMGGSDVFVYEGAFNSAPSVLTVIKAILSAKPVMESWENGFILICSVIKALGFSYYGFTLIYACAFYFLLYHGLKRYVNNWAIFIAVFMYKIFFYNTFISIRQGLTLAIFCFALRYIEDREIIKYFALCSVAYLCHKAASILFPLYFINYIPLTKEIIKKVALIFAPTWFLRNTVDLSSAIMRAAEILGSVKGEHWAEAAETINLLHTLECYIVFFVIYSFFDFIEDDEKSKMLIKMMLILFPMFTIGSNWIIFTRLKDYFVLFYGVILGTIAEKSQDSIVYDDICLATFVLCFIGMIRYVIVFDNGVLINFVSFIFKGKSIFSW